MVDMETRKLNAGERSVKAIQHDGSAGSGDAEPACYTLDDLSEGAVFELVAAISDADIDRFAEVSGDYSPLHMDEAFAKTRGFEGRVVHGLYLGALVSRAVGMHFPGKHALLQSVNLRFTAPAHAGMTIRLRATVDQVSKSVQTLILKVLIEDVATQAQLARGKVQVGITTN